MPNPARVVRWKCRLRDAVDRERTMCGSKTARRHSPSWYTVTLYDVGRPTAPISELSGTVLIKASPAPLHKVGAAQPATSRSLRGPDRRVQRLTHTTVRGLFGVVI